MAWHLRHMVHRCMCGRWATHELYNPVNSPYGYYCQPCGTAEVKKRNAEAEAEPHKEERYGG